MFLFLGKWYGELGECVILQSIPTRVSWNSELCQDKRSIVVSVTLVGGGGGWCVGGGQIEEQGVFIS